MDYYREHGENHEEAIALPGDLKTQNFCFERYTGLEFRVLSFGFRV